MRSAGDDPSIDDPTAQLQLRARRLELVADLVRQPAEFDSLEAALCDAVERLAAHPRDLPVVLAYLRDGAAEPARLVAQAGFLRSDPLRLAQLDTSVRACMSEGSSQLLEGLDAQQPELPRRALLLPIQLPGDAAAIACLVAGVSDRLPLDAAYLEFYARLADDLALVLARARTLHRLARDRDEELARTEAARAVAEQASRAKDEFLAMLGHELRNPLAPITVALQLMRLRGDQDSERERTVIERQVRHLSTLVDDLLDVSRVVRGKVALQRRDVSLANVVSRAVELAGPAIEQHQHELSIQINRAIVVHADPTRLAQVIANLLDNAAKYTPPGGHIELWAEILADPRTNEAWAALHVRDDGIGIPATLLPQVFDLFMQGERGTLDRAQGGLGLGLALVKNLVELHGGRVEANSDGEQRGSEFLVHLPIHRLGLDHVDSAPFEIGRPLDHVRLRVLVVDDNTDAADMLVDLLALLGHEVRAHYEPFAALAAAPEFAPQLLFLDIGLPGIDGYELAKRLRARLGKAATLVALTGYGQDSDIRSALAAGFDHHLVKPIDFGRLQELLELLSRRTGSAADPD